MIPLLLELLTQYLKLALMTYENYTFMESIGKIHWNFPKNTLTL